MDMNNAPYKEIDLDDQKIRIAQVCFDAELFINLPKIKTHAEAGFSCALKNLMGCVVGFDKQKVHKNLHHNLYLLNQLVKPDLHIVDGLIGMEGTGPSSGTPVKLDLLIAGKSAAQIDWVASTVAGLDYHSIPLLRMALEEGLGLETVASWRPIEVVKNFRKPRPPFLQRVITDPTLRPWFVRFRYMPGINKLFSTELWSKVLYALKGGQEKYLSADADITDIAVNLVKCDRCSGKPCLAYCPMGIHPADPNGKCIACAYCFLACPYDAIQLNGELGYLNFQLERYEGIIRQVLTHANVKE
jgi:ferredoxin-like protein FixX